MDAKQIEQLLPQTQCGECGFAGCLPYAQALARGTATIDLCPPGGVETVKSLANFLNVDAAPYLRKAEKATRQPALAVIREEECIGCTKCIQACPVDAIIGSAKTLHQILTHECTGCGLCVAPCPVDCIDMMVLTKPSYDKTTARERHQAREIRLLRENIEKEERYQQKRKLAAISEDRQQDIRAKRDFILQALIRTKNKQAKTP